MKTVYRVFPLKEQKIVKIESETITDKFFIDEEGNKISLEANKEISPCFKVHDIQDAIAILKNFALTRYRESVSRLEKDKLFLKEVDSYITNLNEEEIKWKPKN